MVSFIDYHDEADLIAKANASDYGLHGTIYSEDAERAYRIARRVRSGSHAINGMWVDISMPFGGFKHFGHRPRRRYRRPACLPRNQNPLPELAHSR